MPGVDLAHHGRVGDAAQPGDDRVGHGGPRRRAGRATSTSAALGAVVVKSLSAEPVGRATRRPACTRRRPACSTASACRAPASRPGCADELPALAGHRRPGGGQHLGPHGRGLRRGGRAAGRRAGRGRGRRGQRQLPEPRGPRPACSPTRRDGDRGRRWRPRPRAGGRRWAKLSPNVDRPGRDRRRRPRGRGRGGHAGQHRAGHGHRRRDPPARARRPAAAGCRARPSTRSPCGPSTTCTPAHPDLPIVGRRRRRARGDDAVELLLAGAPRRAGRHGDLRRSPGRRPGCWPSWSAWCRRHGVARPSAS